MSTFPIFNRCCCAGSASPFGRSADLGRKGMKDAEIIALPHQLNRPTFFTLDGDFYDRLLCHDGNCLVFLDVTEELAARCIRRVLRYRQLNTKAKRMGWVLRVMPTGIAYWRGQSNQEGRISWR